MPHSTAVVPSDESVVARVASHSRGMGMGELAAELWPIEWRSNSRSHGALCKRAYRIVLRLSGAGRLTFRYAADTAQLYYMRVASVR